LPRVRVSTSTLVITRPKASALRSADSQSNLRSDNALRGRLVQPTAIAAKPIGTFTPNSHGQGPTDKIAEATVGPSASEAETTIALRPMPWPSRAWG